MRAKRPTKETLDLPPASKMRGNLYTRWPEPLHILNSETQMTSAVDAVDGSPTGA